MIADYDPTDKNLDVDITGKTFSGDARLKRNFLEDSCAIMAVAVTFPEIEMVRIKGYSEVIDNQGNEKVGVLYQANVGYMDNARGANWENLQYSETDLIVANFDSVGGLIMDA